MMHSIRGLRRSSGSSGTWRSGRVVSAPRRDRYSGGGPALGIGDGQRWPGVTVALAAHPVLRSAVRKAILEQGAVGPYIRRMMVDGQPIPQTPEDVRDLNGHALFYVPLSGNPSSGSCASMTPRRCGWLRLSSPVQVSVHWCTERLTAAGVRASLLPM